MIELGSLAEPKLSDVSSSNQNLPFHMFLSNSGADESALRLHQPTLRQLLASNWLADSDSRRRLQGIKGQSLRHDISATRVADMGLGNAVPGYQSHGEASLDRTSGFGWLLGSASRPQPLGVAANQ